MGLADHPVCGARTSRAAARSTPASGNTPEARTDDRLIDHLSGALAWAAGMSDPDYSDCGATVLANYEQTKISAPPNVNEPIGFDQLPDGRILQTTRAGRVRLHDPATGRTTVIARPAPEHVHATARTACTGRRSTTTSRPTSGSTCTTRRRTMDASVVRRQSPTRRRLGRAADRGRPVRLGGQWPGYFQLSRFKFVERQRQHAAVARPRERAEDHEGRRTTAGRAATSAATSTSTATTTCGWPPATTRRPAAATPAASRPTTTRRPTSRTRSASPTPPAARSR